MIPLTVTVNDSKIFKIVVIDPTPAQLRIQDFRWGAPTSDVGAFRQKRMRKRKNWVPLGGGGAAVPPGPPMLPRMIRIAVIINYCP